jgi:hypothetical protein
VHGGCKLTLEGGAAAAGPQRKFVIVSLEPAPVQSAALPRGAVTMNITWPKSETADFAGWTRKLPR